MNANHLEAAKIVLPHARSVEAVRSLKNGAYQVTYLAVDGRRSTFVKRAEFLAALTSPRFDQEIASICYDETHLTQPYMVVIGGQVVHRNNTHSKCASYIRWHHRQQKVSFLSREDNWRAVCCG